MKTRRILAVLLALVLTLGMTALAAGEFSDVPEDAYYADAAVWAAEKGITTGDEDGTFRPELTVTRAEAVTFLWRMAGEPEPTETETFTDVERDPDNLWYKTAVMWAVEEGITDGMGSGEFCPAVTCSRGMILTMLYRMQGRPYDEEGYREGNILTDVREGDWYELPVIWALNCGILGEDQAETPSVTVQPGADCPRGEMVFFLYRASLWGGSVSDTDGPKAVETEIAQIDKYGNLDLAVTPEALRAGGYEPGDVILVRIGDLEIEMPMGTQYTDVDAGTPVCCLRTSGDGTEITILAINSGNLAVTAGIAEKQAIDAAPGYEWSYLNGYEAPVPVILSMARKQGYADEYALHQLTNSRTNRREDYPHLTDADYANFRAVETTGMGKGTLYRSSSPVNPGLNRNREADAALLQAQIRTVIDLADSEVELAQYEGFSTTNYAACDIIALDMGVDFQAAEFQRKLADGLRFIVSHEGPYLIHCNEGKDRAGFAAALLEALMGAEAGEIRADYMRTFYNFYGVQEGTEQYRKISDSFLESSLAAVLGLPSVRDHDGDLRSAAEAYLKTIGMTDEEIAALKERLAAD
jgi:protein tyrosine/serine phosphatase